MLAPFKQIHISEQIISLCFETTRNCDIKELKKKLHGDFPSLHEVTHTFNRINLIFDKSIDASRISVKIDGIDWSHFKAKQSHEYWEIPICFDPHYPCDLMTVFKGDKAAVEAYKKTFLSTTFYLEFYGFLPGFGYLSGLPKECHLDRKSTANHTTPKGTVAVGGAQTGVYPQDSPGGWQAIGYSPVSWMDPKANPPIFVKPRDAVRFKEVTLDECRKILALVQTGEYTPQKQAYDNGH